MAVVAEDDLWFGIFHLDNGGLTRYEDETMTEFEIVEGLPKESTVTEGEFLPDNLVTSIVTDPDGSV